MLTSTPSGATSASSQPPRSRSACRASSNGSGATTGSDLALLLNLDLLAAGAALLAALLLRGRARLAALGLAPLAAFGGFLATAAALERSVPADADAIVVLTGREERMHAGFDLLRSGLADRLLITGVVEGANRLELGRVRDADPALYDAAVELDEAAVSTADNARIAAAWAGAHGFRRLIVVSSAWHLPRGLVLLADAAPEAELQPAAAPARWPWAALPTEWAKFTWERGRTRG